MAGSNLDNLEEIINDIEGARELLNCVGASVNADPVPTRESLEIALGAIERQLGRSQKALEVICGDLLREAREARRNEVE